MSTPFRILICQLDHSYSNPTQGIVKALYEKIDELYYPINTQEYFCETSNVFITKGYDDIEDKFSEQLFEVKAFHTKHEIKEGDCTYVSTIDSVESFTHFLGCAEIIKSSLPKQSNSTIPVNKLPLTKTVFLEYGAKLYGPFNVLNGVKGEEGEGVAEITLEAKPVPLKSNNGQITLPAFNYFSVDMLSVNKNIVSSNIGGARQFVSNTLDILNIVETSTFVDFISDEMVINKYGSEIANNPQIRNFTKVQIRLIRDKVTRLKEYRAHKNRYERLFELFNFPELWDRERAVILEEYFSSEKGKQITNEYFDNNKDVILAEKLKLIEKEITEEAENLRKNIIGLEDNVNTLEALIRNKKQELQSLEDKDQVDKTKLTEQAKQITDDELDKKRIELAEIEQKLAQLKEKYNRYDNLDVLEKRISDLKSVISYDQDTIKDLTEQKDKITKEIHDKNNELLNKLVELKPKVDMLSGVLSVDKRKPEDFSNPKNYSVEAFNVDAQLEVLENIDDKLNTLGRKLDFEELTNVVISIAQSQFTLFSGLPGTGKTSMAKLLGQAMGIKRRLLTIPVARGWTSQRDIIGFYNTLSQSYVPSATGLYDLLSQIQEENDGDESSTSIVLLDEFNLSQPEHYFSPFMEMADPESNRMIHTGDPKIPSLYVPNHVRFVGTINNDESVQTLTPRMIDRSAIIHFDDIVTMNSVVSPTNQGIKTDSLSKVLSGNDFIQLFNTNTLHLPENIAGILNEIVEALNTDNPKFGNPIIVSYRKIKAISSYYCIASPIMITGKLTALDYAVSQHIIPLIHGYGQGFGLRLSNVLSVIPSDMTRSRKRLERIIAIGEQNLHTYGAFL